MAKAKSIFVCSECGNESPKWLGKCPACNSWNTFYEQKIEKYTESNKMEKKLQNMPKPLNSYIGQETNRLSTGFSELDRVLGGGLVKGSLILLGGEPGIGKSTLILQLCEKAKGEGKVLYVSGEESAEQIKFRADRLKINNDDLKKSINHLINISAINIQDEKLALAFPFFTFSPFFTVSFKCLYKYKPATLFSGAPAILQV